MRRILATSLLATLGLALAPPGARADEPTAAPAAPSAPAPREAAREHYRRGKALQAQGAYADAIAEYEQGFALVPTPEFLFNIAQCHRLSGNAPDAVDYYRRYLDAAPAGAGAEEARGHIVTLTRQIEAERREAAAHAPPVTPPAPAASAPAPSTPALTDAAPATSTPPLGVWQWTGVSAGAVGLVATGFATYYAVRADRLAAEVSVKGTDFYENIEPLVKPESQWDDVLTAKYHEGQRDANLALGLYIGAGALVAGGVVAYFWGPRPGAHAEPRRVHVAPTAGPGQVGLSLAGIF